MRRKALLVHADVDVLVALRSELQRRGFMTLAARSADEAVDLHQGIAPDVVLLGPELDDGPDGVLRGRLASGAPLLLLAQLPAAPAEVAARAAAALAPRPAPPPEPETTAPPRTPTLVLPATPAAARAGDDPARIDTLITELLPADAYGNAREEDDGVLGGELEHPLYQTQVNVLAAPRSEAGADDDDSYSDERVPTREQLDTSFFDLALGAAAPAPPPVPVPAPAPLQVTPARRSDRAREADPAHARRADRTLARDAERTRVQEGPRAAPAGATAPSAVPPRPGPPPAPAHGSAARRTGPLPAAPTAVTPRAAAPHAADTPATGPRPAADAAPPRAILVLEGRSTETGDLAKVELARLLCAIHEQRLDGTLTCRAAAAAGTARDAVEKSLAFRQGAPIFATSTDPADRLSELLFREGRLTRDQRTRAAEALAQMPPGRRVGALLLDLGFLKEAELVPAVTRHLQTILYSLFGWTDGAFRFLAGEPAPREVITFSTPVPLLVLEGVRRKYDGARLAALVPPSSVLTATDDLEAVARTLELADDGRRLLQLIDGHRTVAALVEASRVRPVEALRVLHCTVLLRGALLRAPLVTPVPTMLLPSGTAGGAELAPAEQTLREASARGSARATRASPPAPPATDSRSREEDIDRERLREKYRQIRTASYFEILGVTPAATEYEVRRAYEALRATFAPEHFGGGRATPLREELDEVAAVLRDAYEVLADDLLREAYTVARQRDGR